MTFVAFSHSQGDFAIYFCYFQLQELPEHNYESLKFLMNHLKTVSDNCDKNKVSLNCHFAFCYGYPVKTADISHHWCPCEMRSEDRAQKFRAEDVSVVLLIG